jgi:hypothetical protein
VRGSILIATAFYKNLTALVGGAASTERNQTRLWGIKILQSHGFISTESHEFLQGRPQKIAR